MNMFSLFWARTHGSLPAARTRASLQSVRGRGPVCSLGQEQTSDGRAASMSSTHRRNVSPLILQRMSAFKDDTAPMPTKGKSPRHAKGTSPRRSISPRLRERVNSFSRSTEPADRDGRASSTTAARKHAPSFRGGRPSEAASLVAATQSSAFATSEPNGSAAGSLSIGRSTAAGIASRFSGVVPVLGPPVARGAPPPVEVDRQREWLERELEEMGARRAGPVDCAHRRGLGGGAGPESKGARLGLKLLEHRAGVRLARAHAAATRPRPRHNPNAKRARAHKFSRLSEIFFWF